MAKLGQIGFKIVLSINLNVNDGKNKFEELDISKNVAKIGQLPLWRATFWWKYLGHFFPILTFFFREESNGDKS